MVTLLSHVSTWPSVPCPYRKPSEKCKRYLGNPPTSKLNIIRRLQNRASSIFNKGRLKDNWSRKYLSVEQAKKYDQLVMSYKIINRQYPESLLDVHHYRSQQSNYKTRNSRDLQIPRNNLEYLSKGFHYFALRASNNIPINIREVPTLHGFK